MIEELARALETIDQQEAELQDLKAAREFGEATIQPQDQDTFIATLNRRPTLKDPRRQQRRDEVIEQVKALLKELHELEEDEAEHAIH